MSKYKDQPIEGIIWITLNSLIMVLQTVSIKMLFGSMHSTQIVFLYKLAVWLLILPWVLYKGISRLKTKRLPLYLLRAFLSILAANLYLAGLKNLAIANATAIAFTEPLFATILSIFILQDKLSYKSAIALILGFVGVLLIVRPGTEAFTASSVLVILASITWSADQVAIKKLRKTESSVQYLFYIPLLASIFSFVWIYVWPYIALFFGMGEFAPLKPWTPLEASFISPIAVLAMFYLLHLVFVFKAFRAAPLSVLMPFDYSRLVFSALFGYLLLGETISKWTVIGSLVIMSCAVYIIRDKARAKKKAIINGSSSQSSAVAAK